MALRDPVEFQAISYSEGEVQVKTVSVLYLPQSSIAITKGLSKERQMR